MNIFESILKGIIFPLKALDKATSDLVAEKAVVGTQAALALVPRLQELLDGQEVTVVIKIRLQGPGVQS